MVHCLALLSVSPTLSSIVLQQPVSELSVGNCTLYQEQPRSGWLKEAGLDSFCFNVSAQCRIVWLGCVGTAHTGRHLSPKSLLFGVEMPQLSRHLSTTVMDILRAQSYLDVIDRILSSKKGSQTLGSIYWSFKCSFIEYLIKDCLPVYLSLPGDPRSPCSF